MDDYKPNSHKSREPIPEKKAEKAVIGPVKTRKKTDIRKLADVFISDDVDSVKSYIWMDVLVPAAKKTVSDIVSGVFDIIKNTVDIYLYGEDAVRKKSSNGSRTSYGKFYDKRDDSRSPRDARYSERSRARFDYEYLLFDSRGDVESIIAKMEDVIEEYDHISVATLYNDILDRSAPYTAENYGWTNVKSAHAERVWDYEERRYRYELKLPKVMAID